LPNERRNRYFIIKLLPPQAIDKIALRFALVCELDFLAIHALKRQKDALSFNNLLNDILRSDLNNGWYFKPYRKN